MSLPHAAPRSFALLKAVLLLLGAQAFFNLLDATGKYLVRDFPVVTVRWDSRSALPAR